MPDQQTLGKSNASAHHGWQFWTRSNEDPVKIICMAVLVAFCCALLVSSAEQLLRDKRLSNIEAQRQSKMAAMLASLPGLESIIETSGADSLDTKLIDLTTGKYTDAVDVESYDAIAAESDPTLGTSLAKEIDIAGLGSRADIVPIYLLSEENKLALIVLPVHGVGYQSVIRAWLVLSGDLSTVVALSIFEQGETPGLGTRILDESWLAQFSGKPLRDASGALRLKVAKGKSGNEFEVDGITGATRTGDGINNLIEFWLGDYGYGPFLATLVEG